MVMFYNNMRKKYPEKELIYTTSDYLCVSCYEPIYINEENIEICINKSCKLCTKSQIIDNESIDEEYEKRIKSWKKSLENFQIFSEHYFKKRLNDIRHCISISSWRKGQLGSWDLMHVNSILVDYVDKKSGFSIDLVKFMRIFEQSRSAFDKLNQFEHVKSGDTKFIDDEYQLYESKYGRVIKNEYLKNHGIIDPTRYDHDNTNQFDFIINQRKTKDVIDMGDFGNFFKKYYDVVEQLYHFFQITPRTSDVHKYPATANDFTALLQLTSFTNAGISAHFSKKYLKRIYKKSLRENNMKYDFENFENFEKTYCGNISAPLLIYDGKEYNFDFETMYIHLLYIFALNDNIEGTMYKSGFETIQDERKESSEIFETVIRNDLRAKNFTVYPEEKDILKKKIDDNEYQYDSIAIDEKKKKIIIIEAKFRNISPASITVTNFIQNIILDSESGLLHFAKQHAKRVQFFKNNYKKIIPDYNFSKFTDYKVCVYIIMKFTPMIDSYSSVDLISYEKFKTMLSNHTL